MEGNILIIDDEEQLRKLLGRIIALEGFRVTETATLKHATDILERQEMDVILCDVRLPDGNGVDFVKKIKKSYPAIEVVLLTAYGNIPDGVQAMKNGAFDYIVKGNDNDRIIPLLHQAMEQSAFRKKSSVKISSGTDIDFHSILGNSRRIQDAVALARKIAPVNSTVLLLGETGTGKEVFANAIHHNSLRKSHSFVAINCSAFGKDLLESEIFGHKAGAYTGATKDKKGLVEIADGGTLFLDEIGDLHIDLQAKLLRFLENGEFIKVGDTKISKANVRIIAATNRDIVVQQEEGKFREDLYYRLNVFSIELPPLRERVEDIPILAQVFVRQFSSEQKQISTAAVKLLQHYNWKGNIRELKNVMERAVVLSDDEQIRPEHLPYDIQRQTVSINSHLSLSSVEKKHIRKILDVTKGNKAKAARLLEIGLATLYRKIDEYQLH